MTAALTLLDASAAADAALAQVGGKAQQLGWLVRYGLPVPDFFVIPSAWSAARAAGVSVELRGLLLAELARRGWLDQPLAVRSSAVGEDAGAASFAGIYRTCLNVTGVDALCAAVAEVWASLDTPTAQAYRAKLGVDAAPAMAVVVMPMLPAVAAGIAFTCEPVSGREDRIVVHANWGLGESLVGGEAAGDEYVFAEDTTDVWRLLARNPGSKASMSVAQAGGGTRHEATPPRLAGAAVLDGAQAEGLAALVRDAALAFDFVAPFYDIEWVWDGEQFWLTQARPVTRRSHHTYAALRAQPAIWTRGNTGEIMPEPLQAMDWNFSRRGCNDLLMQGWQLMGYPLLPGAQRAGLFDGRLYLEASLMQWEAWDAIGLLPERFNALMGGHQPVIETQPPGWRQRLRQLARTLRYVHKAQAMGKRGDAEVAAAHALAREVRALPLPEDNAAIRALLHRVLRPARESLGMFFLQGSGGGSLSLLLDTLERRYPGESAAIGAALLAGGEPSVTAAQGYALLALAQQAAEEAGSPQNSPAFAAALARFMAQYGHRGHYETYLRSPRYHEQPESILAQLPALAEVDGEAMRARQLASAEAAWARLKREQPWWLRLILRAQVKAANRDSNRREAARSAMIALLAAGRHLWLQIGARLVREGVLPSADAVFHFMPSEIERYAWGQLSASGLRARLAPRQARFAAWQAITPHEWFSLAASGSEAALLRSTPENGQFSKEAEVFRGVATGAGIARGKVRRLRHPSQGAALQAGEILVAPSTDPGWTPLFLKAGGLVVETGGYMSHGAIVAREFALPAVVNLPGILSVLVDGEEIEVDGLRGEVRRIKAGT